MIKFQRRTFSCWNYSKRLTHKTFSQLLVQTKETKVRSLFSNENQSLPRPQIQQIQRFQEEMKVFPPKQSVSMDRLFNRERERQSRWQEEKSVDHPEVAHLIKQIDSVFEKKLFTWQEVPDWKFKLPPTIFSGNESPVRFVKQQQENEVSPVAKLTKSQLDSIKQSGEFLISNNPEELGTTWKINSWILKGKKNIRQTYFQNMSLSWHQINQIPYRLKMKFNNTWYLSLFAPNFWNGLNSIYSIIPKTLNLIFGLKSMQILSDEKVLLEIEKKRFQQLILKESLKIDYFKFIHQLEKDQEEEEKNDRNQKKYKQTRSELDNLYKQIELETNKLQKERLSVMQRQSTDEEEDLIQLLSDKQNCMLSIIEKLKLPQNSAVRQHLMDLIKATQILILQFKLMSEKIYKKRQEIKKELQGKFPIKSQVTSWLNNQINEQVLPFEQEIAFSTDSKIISELNQEGLREQSTIFQSLIDNKLNQKQIFQENYQDIQESHKKPCVIFETFRELFGEREIIKTKNSDGSFTYSEVKTQKYETPTSYFGWRIVLQLVRIKAWTMNSLYYLYQNLEYGQFSLKALFETRPFYFHYDINPQTGDKIPSIMITPYDQLLRSIFQGIAKSKIEFEQSPDRSIFGKSLLRIVKYVEWYIFRGLFVGVGVIGIGMPIGVFINCVASTFLVATSFIWVPAGVLISSIFSVLVYDFDSPFEKLSLKSNIKKKYQSSILLPSLEAAMSLLMGAFETTSSLLCATVIHPGLSLVAALFSTGRKMFSEITDWFMLSLLRLFGRQPQIDSLLAWKIKGKGVTKQYSNSVNIEDVKFLVRSELEQIELNEFETSMINRINEPVILYNQLVEGLLQNYGRSQSFGNNMKNSTSKLNDILQKQLSIRRKILPSLNMENVKFTQQELQILIPSCQEIVKEEVTAKNMESFIFQNYEKHDIQQNDYKALTERILIDIFNDNDVLIPISELDKRIEIKTIKSEFYISIQQAINGKIQLQQLSSSFAPLKRKLYKHEICKFVTAEQVEKLAKDANNHFNKQSFFRPYSYFENKQKDD